LEQRLLATERWLDECRGGVFSIQLLGQMTQLSSETISKIVPNILK
jgi:hypothetical protein